MFISFANGNGSAFENSLDSGRISFRKRPCAMYKDNAVGNVVAETGRDLVVVFGTTARLSDLSMPLTGEVRRSPEPSARPSAAADSEERQICTTCLFSESVGLCLCFLPSCAMYKDNAVANVVAEMAETSSLWLRHNWAIFQCCWKARFDSHLNSLHGSR